MQFYQSKNNVNRKKRTASQKNCKENLIQSSQTDSKNENVSSDFYYHKF